MSDTAQESTTEEEGPTTTDQEEKPNIAEGEQEEKKDEEEEEEGTTSTNAADVTTQQEQTKIEEIEKKPLTQEMLAEGLSCIAKTGDGSGYALVRLEMRERGITDVEDAGKRLEHVRFVDLSHNQIADPTPLTTKLRYLLSLDLGWNMLSGDLDHHLPRQLPYLQWASFEHNRITGIGNLDLPLLSSLSLNGNMISEIAMTGVPMLETLEMKGNLLTNTSGFPSKIKKLDLSENKIEKLVLTGMHSLETIDLRGNSLKTLDLEGAEDATSLTTIILKDNKIETFTEIAKLSKINSLRSLILTGNPIDQHEDYRMEVLVALRQLADLDDEGFSEEDREESKDIAAERKAEAEAKAAAEKEAELENQRLLEDERLRKEAEELRLKKEADEKAAAANAAQQMTEQQQQTTEQQEETSQSIQSQQEQTIAVSPPPPLSPQQQPVTAQQS